MKAKKGITILIFGVLLLAITAGAVFAADPPTERDLFGTVVSVGEGSLTIDTEEGPVEVPVTEDTKIRLPRKKNATLADLVEGDHLAISLEEEDGLLVANKIALIPEKTQTRHLPGVVTAVSSTGMTIEPPGTGSSTTFTLSSTIIRYRNQQATDELPPNLSNIVGKFVVIHPSRDPDTGALLDEALEIRVTDGKPKLDRPPKPILKAEPSNKAKIRGIFRGFDQDGNWIVGETTVDFDDATEIESAFVVGQPVEIEAALQSDGSLLALEAEAKGRGRALARVTRLEGQFNGFDDEGNWIVGGTPVAVDENTDTDGPPQIGQRLKVKALLQKDGTLRAREIENKGRVREDKDRPKKGELEGILQHIDEEGNWIVNGAKVSVDDLTEIEGSPGVGSRLEVKGTLQEDGSFLAAKIEVEEKGGSRPIKKAKIRGNIEAIEDNGETLVVNGLRIALRALTEMEGDPQVGTFVKVEAQIQNGTLVAREVEVKEEEESPEVAKGKKVEIKGRVEKVNEDGSVVVNGLTIAISNLTKQKGKIGKGAFLKVEGVLQDNGSLLAREIKGEGSRNPRAGNEVKVEGIVESVKLDDSGSVEAVVVEGLEIRIEALTEVEGTLEKNSYIKVKGIFSDGAFLASEIEEGEPEEEAEEPDGKQVKIKGFIENVQRDSEGRIISITITGVNVHVDPSTEVKGALEHGDEVEIKGRISNGVLTANKAEGKGKARGQLQRGWVKEVFVDHATPGRTKSRLRLITEESSSFKLTQGGIRWFSHESVKYAVTGTEGVADGNDAIESAIGIIDSFVTTRGFSRDNDSPSPNPCGGKNIVQWVSIDGPGNILATASVCRNVATKEIGGFVVTLDSDETWSTTGAPGTLDVANITTHEFGHVAGLGHVNAPKDGCLTMYRFASVGETQKRSLGLGDKLGMNALYGSTDISGGTCGFGTFTAELKQGGDDTEEDEGKGRQLERRKQVKDKDDEDGDRARGELILQLEAGKDPGTYTLVVIDSEGNPVPGAAVTVNGEDVGTTDDQGKLSINVPDRAGRLHIEVERDDLEGEIKVRLQGKDGQCRRRK